MDIANQAGGIVVGTGDLIRTGFGLGHLQRRPHVHVRRQRLHSQDAGAPYRPLCGRYHRTTKSCARRCWTSWTRRSAPELLPANETARLQQKTEDLVGPYELHDFFLYYTAALGPFRPAKDLPAGAATPSPDSTMTPSSCKWLRTFFRRFFNQQFKRSCLPDGPKVGSVTLSPRGDWRMPSDAVSALWLAEIDELKA